MTIPGAARSLSVRAAEPRPDDSTPPASTPSRSAVLIVHGMGQHPRFKTLDAAAQGVIREAYPRIVGDPVTRTVRFGEEELQRVELTLQTESGPSELHLYEAYWAPLTEGQVKLRDIISLAFIAVRNGVKNGVARTFQRYVFGRTEQFPAPVRSAVYFLLLLAVMLSLVVINTTIGAVVGARWILHSSPTVPDGLYADLSTVFNALLVCAGVFAICLALTAMSRGRFRLTNRILAVVSVLTCAVLLLATIGTAVAIPLLYRLHTGALGAEEVALLAVALGHARVTGFNARVEYLMLGLVVVVLAVGVVYLGAKLVLGVIATWRYRRAGGGGNPGAFLTTAVAVVGTVLVAALGAEVVWLGLGDWWPAASRVLTTAGHGVIWVLLVVASAYVRRLLIQYVGDVAAYIEPHTLNRFAELREKIKDAAFRPARAIYGARRANGEFEYDRVAVVGHSLGSVIAYDTLNRLLRDDHLGVATRTFLFLTFGSPLDKTAFGFGVQHRRTDLRDALAASTQPLILGDPARRLPWVNVYSRWDPIGGALDYYDRPGAPSEHQVVNLVDPDATTPFLAHLEHWSGRLVFRTLLEWLPSRHREAWRGTAETSCAHPGWPASRGWTGLVTIDNRGGGA